MRRTALLAVLLLTGCAEAAETKPVQPAHAAEPQHVRLGWLESYPSTGERLRFAVDELDVRANGWSVEIAVTNATRRSFELGVNRAQLAFGLMLFATGDLAEVEQANREGRLPPVRLAAIMKPPPPDDLAPGASWRATLSAPGSLADGSYVRVAFGPLRVVGDPPQGMQPVVFWITDRSHRL
jgi:hypothetical protein